MTTTSLLLISPSPLSTKSDEVNKPNGYKILMKSSSVRLRLDNLPTRVQQYFNFTPSDKPSEFITVLSSDIQKVIRKTHCSVNFVNTDKLNEFKAALNNRFHALQNLPREEEATMEDNWEGVKETLTPTCQVLGLKKCHLKEWVSMETLDKIQEKKNKKTVINNSRTGTETLKTQFGYTEVNKQVNKTTIADKQKYVEELATTAEKAISDDLQPPLLQLISKDDTSNVSKSLRKYGINLQGKTRVKVIEFNSNIDDNMFRVRVKQAEDFLQADHFVVIIIKLKHIKKLLSKKNIQSTTTKADGGEQQLRNLGKVRECNRSLYIRI
ncbi:unnamed protein product [Schistosoma mattheei]|uniref:Uncharacterized protein n=1 Tax=Schistosoma mattheei TaxID=31246 RepID=A0A183PIQ6_9TREM|nr:unnamed protein product [Schistosoma mattheei]